MQVSKKTIIKTSILGATSLFGLINYVALYFMGKKIQNNILRIVSLISPIVSMFCFFILAETGDEETFVFSLLAIFASVSIIAASVLIVANLKNYAYADMLYSYVDEFGINIEVLKPIEPDEYKLTMVVNSQVRNMAKKLFKDKYYSVLVEIEDCLLYKSNKKAVNEFAEYKTEKEGYFENNAKSKLINENINLPIGNCSIVGNEDNFKITIHSRDGIKFDFNVIDGNIVDCLKNGMNSKKVYEV